MNVYAGFGLQKQNILILSIETNHNLYKKNIRPIRNYAN